MDNLAIIAGARGFVGKHLANYLLESGMQVIGLDHLTYEQPNVSTMVVDMVDRESVINAVSELHPKWVFNLTGVINHSIKWPDQRNIMNQHWLSALNLVEAFSNNPPESFINIGSSDEYGDQPAPQNEEMRESPIAPYSAAKVAATHYLQMAYKTMGFPAIIVRFFLVYGPGQGRERLIPWACSTLLNNQVMPTTSGLQKRDFLYVDDAVDGLVQLAKTPEAKGNVFNLASGEPHSIKKVMEIIYSNIGKGRVDFGAIPLRQGEIMELYADTSKIRKITKWQPKYSLADGLKQTVLFYKEQIRLENEAQ